MRRRATVIACLAVVVLQAVAIWSMTRSGDLEPHRVPIVIAAPAVVASSVADQVNAMDGTPFVADWTDDADTARAAVRRGDAVAAVLVDLSGTQDTMLVNARTDDELNAAVTDRLATVERSRDRTATVQQIATAHANGAADGVRLWVLLAALVGFGFVVVVSMVRGPVPPTLALGALRVAGLGAVAVVAMAGLHLVPGVGLPGNAWWVVGLGAAYAFTLGLLIQVAEALIGLVGLAIVAASYVVLATPLISGTSPYLLPEPWGRVYPWLPSGAAQDAVAAVAYFDPDRALRPALVLGAATLCALLTLLLARSMHQVSDLDPDPLHPTEVRHWRLRVGGTMLPIAALLGVGIVLLPDQAVEASTMPSRASESTCVHAATSPADVDELNRAIATMQGAPAFLGGDVGADAELQDGRFLLVFGDTLRSEDFDPPQMVRNSMLLWGTDCMSVVLPKSHGALIPDRGDGIGYWPMSTAIAQRPGYDLVLVSTQRVRTTGGGSFGFANVGSALAVFVVQSGGTPQLIATMDVGPDSDGTSRPEWGAALAADDEWLYLYGTARPADTADAPGFSLQVARVRPEEVLEVGKWRYWDGASWQPDADRAAELVPASVGVSQTLSVFHVGSRWYALSKKGGDFSDEIAFWTSPGPTGPFTATAPVAQAPADADAGEVTYMPLAHPGMFPEDGSIVASYSRNNLDPDKVLADPTLYRPKFLRLTLPDQ